MNPSPIAKAKQTLWKRYERERASQTNNYRKKTDWLGTWRDFVDIPELSLKIMIVIDVETKTPKRYRWIIQHPSFTIETFFPSPEGDAYFMAKKSARDRNAFLPLLKAIESAFGFHILIHPQRAKNKNAETLLDVLHKNKLKNTKIPRNIKQLFGRADPNNNPPLGLDLFSPEANAVIDALEKTTHANTAVPEYWVRYHGTMYASKTMFYRFKVPKDVVIVTFTYPGCPTFTTRNNGNWKAKGHMNAYCLKTNSFPEISYKENDIEAKSEMFVPYMYGDVMPNIHLTTADTLNRKLGLYRRHEDGKFTPVDLETPEIWLSDLVEMHGPGLYFVSSCLSMNQQYMNKIPLVKNLRNLVHHAAKARKRKYPLNDRYSNMLSNYQNLFKKHIDLLKGKKNRGKDDDLRMQKELFKLGFMVHAGTGVSDNNVEKVWKHSLKIMKDSRRTP